MSGRFGGLCMASGGGLGVRGRRDAALRGVVWWFGGFDAALEIHYGCHGPHARFQAYHSTDRFSLGRFRR